MVRNIHEVLQQKVTTFDISIALAKSDESSTKSTNRLDLPCIFLLFFVRLMNVIVLTASGQQRQSPASGSYNQGNTAPIFSLPWDAPAPRMEHHRSFKIEFRDGKRRTEGG
jgi:hypothetical protein